MATTCGMNAPERLSWQAHFTIAYEDVTRAAEETILVSYAHFLLRRSNAHMHKLHCCKVSTSRPRNNGNVGQHFVFSLDQPAEKWGRVVTLYSEDTGCLPDVWAHIIGHMTGLSYSHTFTV